MILVVLDHLTKFGPQMHTETKNNKSKTEAMYFPESVSEAKKQSQKLLQLNDGENNIFYTNSFRYL